MKMLPIVDAHVHFWNPAQLDYPWLKKLPPLNRALLPQDYLAACAPFNIAKMIFVECDYEPTLGLLETDWVCDLAKNEPRLRGIVANVLLERRDKVAADLKQMSERSLVKGIRRNLQAERDLEFCLRPEFIAGVKLLAGFNYTFDICIRHEQLTNVVELVRRVPEVFFILDHFGKPDVRAKRSEPWASDLKALAALPNTACKISGLTTEAHWENWQPEDLKIYFENALNCFGFDRILFGGDWPVATLATNYERWLETVREIYSFASEANQIKLFQTNTERIYRV